MAVRTFIFCDTCNPRGIRSIEERRYSMRRGGRRINDDRAWFEGTEEEARQAGWHIENGTHTCEYCATNIRRVAKED